MLRFFLSYFMFYFFFYFAIHTISFFAREQYFLITKLSVNNDGYSNTEGYNYIIYCFPILYFIYLCCNLHYFHPPDKFGLFILLVLWGLKFGCLFKIFFRKYEFIVIKLFLRTAFPACRKFW